MLNPGILLELYPVMNSSLRAWQPKISIFAVLLPHNALLRYLLSFGIWLPLNKQRIWNHSNLKIRISASQSTAMQKQKWFWWIKHLFEILNRHIKRFHWMSLFNEYAVITISCPSYVYNNLKITLQRLRYSQWQAFMRKEELNAHRFWRKSVWINTTTEAYLQVKEKCG